MNQVPIDFKGRVMNSCEMAIVVITFEERSSYEEVLAHLIKHEVTYTTYCTSITITNEDYRKYLMIL